MTNTSLLGHPLYHGCLPHFPIAYAALSFPSMVIGFAATNISKVYSLFHPACFWFPQLLMFTANSNTPMLLLPHGMPVYSSDPWNVPLRAPSVFPRACHHVDHGDLGLGYFLLSHHLTTYRVQRLVPWRRPKDVPGLHLVTQTKILHRY